MVIHVCELCGYEYNPKKGDFENGIDAGTDFEDLPADWLCPLCRGVQRGRRGRYLTTFSVMYARKIILPPFLIFSSKCLFFERNEKQKTRFFRRFLFKR